MALALTRKVGESVVMDVPPSSVPQKITIFVASFGQWNGVVNKVRIGIDAPKSVKILREELQVVKQVDDDSDSLPNDLGSWARV
jgi:carbon storage regulator CsrA